jgi:uncharacterized membrane protein
MEKGRLEAFSDGAIAFIITIMAPRVLEISRFLIGIIDEAEYEDQTILEVGERFWLFSDGLPQRSQSVTMRRLVAMERVTP